MRTLSCTKADYASQRMKKMSWTRRLCQRVLVKGRGMLHGLGSRMISEEIKEKSLSRCVWLETCLPSRISVSLKLGSVFSVLVSQKPKRDICQSGTSLKIQCVLDSQVTGMFWYRQIPGQSLVLMAAANQGSEATYEKEFDKDKFPISRPNLTFSTLTVSNARPEDSSFYFCSAGDTVLATSERSQQEPHLLPSALPRWA